MNFHPCLNENGQNEPLKNPDQPTPIESWADSAAVARVVPLGELPESICGLATSTWLAPSNHADWQAIADSNLVNEPAFNLPQGLKAAAGVVVRETDGRFWMVSPSNGFGGYKTTFPKGTQEKGLSLQASAIKEAYEEAGLQVELTGFLLDVKRSTSYTRYYTARRVGGNPAHMGWESQSVLLVPKAELSTYLTNAYDKPLLDELAKGGL